MQKTFLLSIAVALLLGGAAGCKSKLQTDLVRLAYPETFAGMVEQFRGRVVYVDIFGSWCQPCIREFGHATRSEDFFTENNIAKLYISVDYKSEGIHKSFELLEKHGMEGYFISQYNPADMYDKSTGFFLQMEEFIKMAGRVVPQYLIIDKNGNVVEVTAKKPSEPDGLKEQLSKYL